MVKKLKIAGATLNQTPLDWDNNLINIQKAIVMAREKSIDILCLPELCITGYGCEDVFLGDWVYARAMEALLTLKPVCEGITVAIGLPVKYKGRNYNTTCIIKDTEILGIYAKQNLANDGVHYETRWFIPWKSSVVEKITIQGNAYAIGDIVIEINGVRMGFEICEDAWRKERPACKLYEKGVNLILNPSASHFAFEKTDAREKLVVTSSKNFHCTYVYANLLGNEAGRMVYDGEILIARHGHLIKRNDWLSFEDVQIQWAEIDIDNDDESYPEAENYDHDKNTEFVRAASLALFDYLRKSHSKGFILSLSGGADSSSIAILAAEMVKRGTEQLGIQLFLKKSGLTDLSLPASSNLMDAVRYIVSQILTCAYQGTINSSDDTFNAAKELANEIGATFHSWTIDEEVSSYTIKIETALQRRLTWENDDITLQNIQARARSPIIWMLANIHNALLLTTSNRSEGDVGYATMDGDTSGSIAPIAAVDKHFLLQWLLWAEKELGYRSLANVNALQPSAELRPLSSQQTDEDDLMPYKIIVEIEKLAIRDHKSPVEVFKTLKKQHLESNKLLKLHITRFYKLWARNQWKRERIAPAFHLDDFNIDPRTWCRFPILSGSFITELEELDRI